MARSWFFPSSRSTEATGLQVAATGAAGGYGVDPIDGDKGFRRVGGSNREVPYWTLEKARIYSIAAYRFNPMARAIIDTYTAFCVGDSGLTLQATNPQVHEVVDKFWKDPRNQLATNQDAMLRHHMLMGESAYEMIVGEFSGVTRFSIIDPTRIEMVELDRGNPLWPKRLHLRTGDGRTEPWDIAQVDDVTGLRTGTVMWLKSWNALLTDTRGQPFLSPVLDWIDNYDQVLSNLMDRTSIMRHIAWDVTLKGPAADQKFVDEWVKARGGLHGPPSGSIEAHNEAVEWKPMGAQVGSGEDTQTAGALLTSVAAGTGLSKPWLAEPENANRATSLTMAEPVRRRIAGVQNLWLGFQTDKCRYVVDQAVAARRLPALVDSNDVLGDTSRQVPPSETVRVTGPEIAAADAEVTATVMVNLSKSLTEMVVTKISSPEAARIAWQKAWEQFVGRPYTHDLDPPMGASKDDIAEVLDSKTDPAQVSLRLA